MPRAFKHALGLIRPATAFQTAAVTPVSPTVTPVQHTIPVAAAVRPISIATTGQLSIATAAVFNPALVAVMTAAGEAAPAARGKPRGAMTVPVYPFIQAGDTSLYENAANPAEKWYLPRYRLATQRVSG